MMTLLCFAYQCQCGVRGTGCSRVACRQAGRLGGVNLTVQPIAATSPTACCAHCVDDECRGWVFDAGRGQCVPAVDTSLLRKDSDVNGVWLRKVGCTVVGCTAVHPMSLIIIIKVLHAIHTRLSLAMQFPHESNLKRITPARICGTGAGSRRASAPARCAAHPA